MLAPSIQLARAFSHAYSGKVAIVTGGLGFIGSNVAQTLAALGARVVVVDSSEPGCGANVHNLAGTDIELAVCDIGDSQRIAPLLRDADLVFNLAGEIRHGHSMVDPERDLRLNTLSQLRFVETCVRYRPGLRVVYAATRQEYGATTNNPTDESHPVAPVDYNGVHKFAASSYHLLNSRRGLMDAVIVRLSNVYGPRMALHVPGQGFLGVYLRRALLGEPLEVWGDGSLVRDPVYVEDVVEALLRAGAWPQHRHRIYNVGGPKGLTLDQIAEIVAAEAGGLTVAHCSYPESSNHVDIGSYISNNGRITRELGWRPRTEFATGIAESLSFYRSQFCHYIPEEGGSEGSRFGIAS